MRCHGGVNDATTKAPDGSHPCPVCGRPAFGQVWQYLSVCDDCFGRALCSHHRPVEGHNTSFSGGFEAVHRDDLALCAQVTDDGSVWVNGVECRMGEVKFGGVFVGVEPKADAD